MRPSSLLALAALFSVCSACVHFSPSGDALRHNRAGLDRLLEGAREEARAHFELALEYRPRFAEARANLGVIFLDEGDLLRAEAAFRRAVADDPDLAIARANLGVVLERTGRVDEALGAYRDALRIDPATYAARFNLARLLAVHGEPRRAARELTRLAALYPEEIAVVGALVIVEIRTGEIDRARARVAEARTREETHPLMHFARGLVSAIDGDLDEAIVSLELARADPALEIAALVRIAALHRLAGREGEADAAASSLPHGTVARAASLAPIRAR